MLYRDIEKVLDTRLTLSVEQQHPIIPLLEREIDVIPVDFHMMNESHVDLFICAEAGSKLAGILGPFRPEKRGDCLVVRVSAEEMKTASTILEEAARIPSTVLGGLYLKGTKIYADYRLHSSALSEITEIGKRIIGMNNRTRISDLGPTDGGISILDSVNSRIHLGVVSYEADVLGEIGLPKEGEYYIEYNFYQWEEKGFRAVVYNVNGFSVRHLKSVFLEDVWKLSVDRRIPRAAILARASGGKYRSYIFLPFSMVDDQLSALYEASKRHPEAGFRLVAVRSYDESIWEWV